MQPNSIMVTGVHPSEVLFRVPGPDDYRSFMPDEDGDVFAALLEHWKSLYYLPYFHNFQNEFDWSFKEVFWTPFENTKHVIECRRPGIILRVYAFEVGQPKPLIAFQFLSTCELPFDLRLTAPDQDTAAKNLRQAYLARMRYPIGPFPLIPYAKAEPMIFGGKPARIAKTAPEIVLLPPPPPPKKSRIVWWRRFIRDPYMVTIWQLKTGEVQIQFTGARHPLFNVASREAGLEWVKTAFHRLEEK